MSLSLKSTVHQFLSICIKTVFAKKNSLLLLVTIPAGFAEYPNEAIPPIRAALLDKFTNLVHQSVLEKGGHFAALEQPKIFTKDLIEFLKKVI